MYGYSVTCIREAFPGGASGSKSVVLEGEPEIEALETFQQGSWVLWSLGFPGMAKDGGLVGLKFLVPDVLPASGAGEQHVPGLGVVGEGVVLSEV